MQLELKLLLSGSVITSDGELGARALIHTVPYHSYYHYSANPNPNLKPVVTLKPLHYGYYVLSPEGG